MTIAEPPEITQSDVEPAPGRFYFEDATWDFYEQTLQQLERAGQHAHVTFDNGRMEIVTTTGWHEGIKTSVARLLEHYSIVADIPIQGFGGVTHKRKDLLKGLEPDECYYVVNRIRLDDKGHLDLIQGPPPDVVLEVQVTRPDIPKRPIYAAMGVPELWSITAERIVPLRLQGSDYVEAAASQFFPKLEFVQFQRFVRMAQSDQHAAVKAFDAYLRGAEAAK